MRSSGQGFHDRTVSSVKRERSENMFALSCFLLRYDTSRRQQDASANLLNSPNNKTCIFSNLPTLWYSLTATESGVSHTQFFVF